MPNRNYQKGIRKERKLVNDARRRGLIAFRSAGSHSPIDLVIINPALRSVRLIQCKTQELSDNQVQKILAPMKELNDFYKVCFQIM